MAILTALCTGRIISIADCSGNFRNDWREWYVGRSGQMGFSCLKTKHPEKYLCIFWLMMIITISQPLSEIYL